LQFIGKKYENHKFKAFVGIMTINIKIGLQSGTNVLCTALKLKYVARDSWEKGQKF
jgi:hypothetical protein